MLNSFTQLKNFKHFGSSAIQQTKGMVGFGWFWLVFDQIDQLPTKVNQKRPTSMHLTVARTVMPVGQ